VWFNRTYPLKHVKKCFYWWLWQHRAMEQAKAVIFTSEEEWRNSRCSFTPFRCRKAVVPLGIAAPSGDPEQQRRAFFERVPGARDARLLILFLGRIHVKKGCDLLVEAVRAMRNHGAWEEERFCVGIVGPCADPAWRTQLEARANEGATRTDIVWGEMLSGEAKWGAFRAADAFVLPSHQENFGVAVIEALACGVPALISDQVNIWREVASDGAGIVEHDDVAGTVRLLERWVTLSVDERQRMKERARRCFEQRYEIERAAQKLLDLFQAEA
jgi:glycosyltransferase involved in cell wall biosynthesis